MKLDKFDLAILTALQQDARISLHDLSAKVGLADTVIVQVTLDDHSDQALFEFGHALAMIPEVLEAFLVSGDSDYYLRIAVSDTRDYERLLRERLYKIPGIRHSKSSFVLRQLKQSYLPLQR